MILGRVTGSVVSTAKHPAYVGRILLSVVPIDADDQVIGPEFLAVDHVQVGAGDRVLVLAEGSGVRQILDVGAGEAVPLLELIVAIVDSVEETVP